MIVLPVSGTYTVVITPSNISTGPRPPTPTLFPSTTLFRSAPFDLNIPFRNQQARLTFNGTAGQNVGEKKSTQTKTTHGTIQELQPSGSTISLDIVNAATSNFSATGGSTRVAVALPTTGVYT